VTTPCLLLAGGRYGRMTASLPAGEDSGVHRPPIALSGQGVRPHDDGRCAPVRLARPAAGHSRTIGPRRRRRAAARLHRLAAPPGRAGDRAGGWPRTSASCSSTSGGMAGPRACRRWATSRCSTSTRRSPRCGASATPTWSTQGWSMGGSAVLRHAALAAGAEGGRARGWPVSHPPDAVVSVSATSRWFVRDTAPDAPPALGGGEPGRPPGRPPARRPGRPERMAAAAAAVAGRGTSPGSTYPCCSCTATPTATSRSSIPVRWRRPPARGQSSGRVAGFGHAEAAADAELVERIGAYLRQLVAVAS